MSSYQDKIRARKRNKMQQIQQVNRLFAQRLASGEFGNAETGYDIAGAATTPYTVTDTDTLESIAGANGVDPTDVLAANPDLKNIQTGMVINAPRPGSDAWRAQNLYKPPKAPGGLGLPSNAASGVLATNNGMNAYQAEKQYKAPTYLETLETNRLAQQQAVLRVLTRDTAYPGIANAGEQKRYPLYANNTVTMRPRYPLYGNVDNTPQGPYPLYAGNTVAPHNPYPLYAQGVIAMQAQNNRPPAPQPSAPNATTSQPPTSTTPPLGAYQAQYQYMSRNLLHNQIRTKIEQAGYMPTPGELQILEKMGYIKKTPTASGGGYGGGYYSRGRGGRGGGGGYYSRGGYQQGERLPAFSTGSGRFSLVNWRI